jgi:mersacidin/lichenicidin family type 2 lantibiotic
MSPRKIIRAWKDEDYRLGLNSQDRTLLPDNPAGIMELSDDELRLANGGTTTAACTIALTVGVTVLASCSINCDTVFNGTCKAWSVGCCKEFDDDTSLF